MLVEFGGLFFLKGPGLQNIEGLKNLEKPFKFLETEKEKGAVK